MNRFVRWSSLAATALLAAAANAGTFPVTAVYAGAGTPNINNFLGAPDDLYVGLGAGDVTYDFGNVIVFNRPGQVDLNVYEVDSGGPEFNLMTILVSQDGVTFTSIKSSERTLVRMTGDSVHSNNSFGRSYDLGALEWVRYVRIDGLGTGGASAANGFDLDAIGAHEVRPAIPEPTTALLMLAGLAGLAGIAKRRQAVG